MHRVVERVVPENGSEMMQALSNAHLVRLRPAIQVLMRCFIWCKRLMFHWQHLIASDMIKYKGGKDTLAFWNYA